MPDISGLLPHAQPGYGAGTSIIACTFFWYYALFAFRDLLLKLKYHCHNLTFSLFTAGIFLFAAFYGYTDNVYHYIGGVIVYILIFSFMGLKKSQSKKHLVSQ